MKHIFLNIIAVLSFTIGIFFFVIVLLYSFYFGSYLPKEFLDIETNVKLATIIQGISGTIFLVTTISLLFLTNDIQKKELNETSRTLRQQTEDNHFFSLINTFYNIRNQLEKSILIEYYDNTSVFPQYKEQKFRGNEFFERTFIWYIMFTNIYNPKITDVQLIEKCKKELEDIFPINRSKFETLKPLIVHEEEWAFYGSAFSAYYGLISDELSNYFNFLIQILKYSNRCLESLNYFEYIKSILSKNEIALFFYYGLTNFQIRKYLIDIGFFKNVNQFDLIDKIHLRFYNSE